MEKKIRVQRTGWNSSCALVSISTFLLHKTRSCLIEVVAKAGLTVHVCTYNSVLFCSNLKDYVLDKRNHNTGSYLVSKQLELSTSYTNGQNNINFVTNSGTYIDIFWYHLYIKLAKFLVKRNHQSSHGIYIKYYNEHIYLANRL